MFRWIRALCGFLSLIPCRCEWCLGAAAGTELLQPDLHKVAYDAVGAGFSRRVPRSGILATKWRLARDRLKAGAYRPS
jgi:hypothetical protein